MQKSPWLCSFKCDKEKKKINVNKKKSWMCKIFDLKTEKKLLRNLMENNWLSLAD